MSDAPATPTPAPGAAADLGTPASTAEQAAPSTAEQAVARIAALRADPAWVKLHLSGDAGTRTELAHLHELAYKPTPGSITVGGPTLEAQRALMADHLGTSGVSPRSGPKKCALQQPGLA